MKKLLKKAVIYLLLAVLVIPSWLVLDLLTAQKAHATDVYLPAAGDIIVSEFSPSTSTEWVELLNTKNFPIDISGWKFADAINTIRTIPVAVTIPAQGLYVFETPDGWLNNSGGDSLTLSTPTMTPIYSVTYGDIVLPAEAPHLSGVPTGIQSVAFDGASFVKGAPTKGWFNYGVPTLAEIKASLPTGITSNIDTIVDPTKAAGLSFSKADYGKITFSSTINLTDQATVSTLQALSTNLDIDKGKIAFSPDAADVLKTLGASLEMSGLTFPEGTTPTIYVDGVETTTADVDTAIYSAGTLTFNAKHFSTYTVDMTAPTITNTTFTSKVGEALPITLTTDGSGNFILGTDAIATTDYLVQFADATVLSEPISGYAPLMLTGLSDAKKLELKAYYDNRSGLPDAFKTYLKSAVDGTNPFAYIYSDLSGKAKLADAAKRDLIATITDMTIPGDYPEGVYPVSGQVSDLLGNSGPVSFGLLIDHTAPNTTSILINGGASLVNTAAVTLTMTAEDNFKPIQMMISDNGDLTADLINTDSGIWQTFAATKSWLIEANVDGVKTVYVKFRDGGLKETNILSASITMDKAIPTFSSVSISSDNSVSSAFAKSGDIVTLKFTASEEVQSPVVLIAGHSVVATQETSTNNYTAVYTMKDADTEGKIAFTLNASDLAGNAATEVSATTDATSVTFDKTSPIASSDITDGTLYGGSTWTGVISGHAQDTNIANVYVSIERSDGKDWSGTTWKSGSYIWNVVEGVTTWSYNLDKSNLNDDSYSVRVKVVDKAGNDNANPSYQVNKFEIDKTGPAITLLGQAAPIINLNASYVDAGVTAIDARDGDQTKNVTISGQVLVNIAGTYEIKYTVLDLLGNQTIATRTVVVLPENKIVETSNTVVTSTAPEVVVASGNTTDSTITVPLEVTNASLNLAAILTGTTTKTATLTNNIFVLGNTALGQIQIVLPVGMKISGPTDWNGSMSLPTIVRNATVGLPQISGFSPKLDSVVEVGFGDVKLTFDKAVRILLPGKAGKLAGYTRSGVFTAIDNLCSADSQVAGNALAAEGDCKIEVGNDLVIWTKHFTKFVSYSQQQLVIKTETSEDAVVEKAPVAQTVQQAPAQTADSAKAEDVNGIVAGTDKNSTDESTNWTPWIILFVLILLAGAATGGYFYWFAGKEEATVKVTKPAKKIVEEMKLPEVKKIQKSNKSSKKSKRW